jgi:hypothetical protein
MGLAVNNNHLTTAATSTKSFKKEGPVAQPSNMGLAVNNHLTTAATSTKSFKKEGPVAQPCNISITTKQLLQTKVDSNVKKFKDLGDHGIVSLNDVLKFGNSDHVNRKGSSKQNYIHSKLHLDKNVPNYQVQPMPRSNIIPDSNINRDVYKYLPNRAHSKFGFSNGGTISKVNTPKLMDGVTLKLKN